MDGDGFLYLFGPAGQYVSNVTWKGLPRNNTMYLTRIDADGIFRLYSYDTIKKENWFIRWLSSDDLCRLKGICGLNMYCMMIDPKVDCVCLPGFAPVQEGNWTSGCESNFTQDSCKRRGENADFTIQPVANTVWSHTIRLPLTFGRSNLANSITVSIKLSTATSDANAPRLSGHQMYLEHGVSIGSIEDVGPRLFTYEELKEVTKDFKDEIGKGAFGTVYKGTLLNCRKVVAIKRLENISSDGDIEFQTKVKIIGRTHHWNLVCLLGYCQDGHNRLLVLSLIPMEPESANAESLEGHSHEGDYWAWY
ncbi:hypothetical protein NL676_019629 [Syzygium grande]|nr:hypothetical protein NL676_019629 [Syzygium grande]